MDFFIHQLRLFVAFCIGVMISPPDALSQVRHHWDSTARPSIYQARVDQFASYGNSEEDILFIGDSITFWADWTELLKDTHVKNRGIPGDNTFGLLERLENAVRGHPAKVFIMIGINDLAFGVPDSVILVNYMRIIQCIKEVSPETFIYFQTLLPTNDSFKTSKNHYGKDHRIRNINGRLQMLAEKEGIGFIDLYSYFVDDRGRLREEFTWDGVHLTWEGYRKWMTVLEKGKYLVNPIEPPGYEN